MGLLGQLGGLDLGDEVVGQLVGHVKAPAAGTGAQPLAHHAVLAADELAVLGVALIQVGQGVNAPPAAVGTVGAQLVPATIGRVLALEGAYAVVVAVAVEVQRVGSGMVEHAVQDDGDAALAGLVAQALEALLVAQHRVDLQVVARVVAMRRLRLEDGVKVQHRHAQAFQIVKVLADALQRAAVEVPLGDAAVLVTLVVRGLVPVVHQGALGAVGMQLEGSVGALVPVLAAREAVGEDLVDDALLVPLGKRRAQHLVAGDLERRRLAQGEGSLAGGALGTGAVAPHVAVSRGYLEAVPHELGLVGNEGGREADGVAVRGALHVDERLAFVVNPKTQLRGRLRLVPHVDPQGNGATNPGSPKRIAVLKGRGHMLCSQIASIPYRQP